MGAVTSRSDARRDRILHGPLGLEVLRFGGPLALGMGLQVVFNLVDQLLVSRLPEAIATPSLDALGICDMVVAVGSIICYGLGTAAAAHVSQHKGRGDLQAAARAAWASLGLLFGLGGVCFVAGAFGSGFIVETLMGARGATARVATSYLRLMLGGSVTVFLTLHLVALLRAVGRVKSGVLVMVIGNLFNMFLGALLIYGQGDSPSWVHSWAYPIATMLHLPRLLLDGGAWAALVARTLAALVLFAIVARELPRAELFPGGKLARELVRVAWPASAQYVVRIAATLLAIALLHHYFTTDKDVRAGTAYALCLRMETMALFLSIGWGSGAQTFAGMALGAGLHARAVRAGWTTAAFTVGTMAVLSVVYLQYGTALLGFFTQDPVVIDRGTSFLRVVGPSYLFFGLAIALAGAMSGAGATRLTLRLDTLIVVLIEAPLLILAIALRTEGDPSRLWWALAATNAVSAVVYCAAYLRAPWRESFAEVAR
jgi:Na+-driven multidrug efflux pump